MEKINVSNTLRLRMPQKSEWDLALPWYENPKVMYLSEGISDEVYTLFNIYNMYEFLSTRGDFYYIEVLENNKWKPIGDVTLWDENLPIAIGDETYWGQGIGRQVLLALIERAKQKGMKKLLVPAIFHYNIASQKLFESVGFVLVSENETEKSYELIL
ncbi:MAG TPA: GNAT family N-acetyltransferase [Firmicutes bacterium]|nr:GNAT family N-acetyltransferase [Bacillota bacterium]